MVVLFLLHVLTLPMYQDPERGYSFKNRIKLALMIFYADFNFQFCKYVAVGAKHAPSIIGS